MLRAARHVPVPILLTLCAAALFITALAGAQDARPRHRRQTSPTTSRDSAGGGSRLVPADRSVPLPPAARAILDEIPNEGTPAPPRHYPVSNEYRHDILFPQLANRGGAYVGVGSDQNYTMAAAAGSELLLLVDYDPLVPMVHRLYSVLVPASETPAALIERLDEPQQAQTIALIRSTLAGAPDVEAVVDYFRSKRHWLFRYLRRMNRTRYQGHAVSWIGDQELYDRVRTLHRAGRIISRNGDVTGARTVRAIGDAARRLGVVVRVVYFSNAEQFFPYSASFVANMESFPTDERTIVVRTIRHRRIPVPEGCPWHYMVHDFRDFLSRIKDHGYRRSFRFSADLLAAGPPHLGREGLSVMTADTPRRGEPARRR